MTQDERPDTTLLTRRQLEVLELLAKGLTNREIAAVLGIATGTAKAHVSAVIEALDVTNRTEAAVALSEMGRTSGPAEADPVPGFGERPAIAVLPFDNLGADAEHDVFAEGLAEDLTTALASWRWFPVIARNSTFAYKGKPFAVTSVARELGARYVIEGSSRREGDQVRIHLQLIDGETGNHLYAERFDRRLDDILAVQDEISQAIFGVLEPTLLQLEGLRAIRRPTTSVSVWESFQRGMHLLMKQTGTDVPEARAWFEKAIEVDASFAPAHAGLAMAHVSEALFGVGRNQEDSNLQEGEAGTGAIRSLGTALEAARRAVELDPMDSIGHTVFGGTRAILGDRAGGVASLLRSLELNPSSAAGCFVLGIALFANGEAERALHYLERCMRLSPRDPMLHHFLGTRAATLSVLDQLEEALGFAESSVDMQPEGGISYLPIVALSLAKLDRDEEAREVMRRVFELAPGFNLRLARLVAPSEFVDDLADCFERLGFSVER